MLVSMYFLLVQKFWLIILSSLTTHHLAVFGGLTYIVCFSMMKMFAPLLPPERLVPIIGMIATSNGCTCQHHHFGCGSALLMGLPAHDRAVLLRLKKLRPATVRLILFYQTGAMVAGCFCSQGTCCWSTKLFSWWNVGADDWSLYCGTSQWILPITSSLQSWLQSRGNCHWRWQLIFVVSHQTNKL